MDKEIEKKVSNCRWFVTTFDFTRPLDRKQFFEVGLNPASTFNNYFASIDKTKKSTKYWHKTIFHQFADVKNGHNPSSQVSSASWFPRGTVFFACGVTAWESFEIFGFTVSFTWRIIITKPLLLFV